VGRKCCGAATRHDHVAEVALRLRVQLSNIGCCCDRKPCGCCNRALHQACAITRESTMLTAGAGSTCCVGYVQCGDFVTRLHWQCL
jgi:hypothetical protein